jgi:hypothetical protein
LRVQCTQTIMRTPEDRADLARAVLSSTISGLLSDQPVSEKSVSDKSAARTASDQP